MKNIFALIFNVVTLNKTYLKLRLFDSETMPASYFEVIMPL